MKYYFDESGNWNTLEGRNPLVMCGVVFLDRPSYLAVHSGFNSIRAEYKLSPFEFHGTDASDVVRENVYSVMHEALFSGSTRALVMILDPMELRKTRESASDIYIRHASSLISRLAMGDPAPRIYSDMKFRGAYPARVAQLAMDPSFRTGQATFDRIMGSYELKEDSVGEKHERISKLLAGNSTRRPTREMTQLKGMIRPGETGIFKRYEFAELWLDWTEREGVREKYRDRILEEINQIRESLGMDLGVERLRLLFVDKASNNPGVQFADFLCNLVYRSRVPQDQGAMTSGLVSGIIDKCIIGEARP